MVGGDGDGAVGGAGGLADGERVAVGVGVVVEDGQGDGGAGVGGGAVVGGGRGGVGLGRRRDGGDRGQLEEVEAGLVVAAADADHLDPAAGTEHGGGLEGLQAVEVVVAVEGEGADVLAVDAQGQAGLVGAGAEAAVEQADGEAVLGELALEGGRGAAAVAGADGVGGAAGGLGVGHPPVAAALHRLGLDPDHGRPPWLTRPRRRGLGCPGAPRIPNAIPVPKQGLCRRETCCVFSLLRIMPGPRPAVV